MISLNSKLKEKIVKKTRPLSHLTSNSWLNPFPSAYTKSHYWSHTSLTEWIALKSHLTEISIWPLSSLSSSVYDTLDNSILLHCPATWFDISSLCSRWFTTHLSPRSMPLRFPSSVFHFPSPLWCSSSLRSWPHYLQSLYHLSQFHHQFFCYLTPTLCQEHNFSSPSFQKMSHLPSLIYSLPFLSFICDIIKLLNYLTPSKTEFSRIIQEISKIMCLYICLTDAQPIMPTISFNKYRFHLFQIAIICIKPILMQWRALQTFVLNLYWCIGGHWKHLY